MDIRLSKIMADRGLCSRREADRFIEAGMVRVNGQVVHTLGAKVDPSVQIELSTKANQIQQRLATILLHKPVGYVSGQPEDNYQPAITLIRSENQDPHDRSRRLRPEDLRKMAPAGRLDIDSQGLLVFTQDGRIARQLIGANSSIDKEYLVRVRGKLSDQGLKLLCHGLSLDDRPLKPAQVRWLNADQLQFILREGRKRQIRRMCELVGLEVVGLKRVRIGKVRLGDLQAGQWRFLGEQEF